MSQLDAPLTLRNGVTLKNRLALAPMTNTQSHEDGTLGDDELRWLLARARGGFGLVSTCAAYVSDEGKAWHGQLGIAHDTHLPGLTRLASALREAGTTSIVQLYHGGKVAKLAPGLRLSTADEDGVRGATSDDFDRVVSDFMNAALRAQRAGFAGIEVHGANGYLFTQFLAPLDNPRTDAYGGDLAGRARLLRQVVRAIRAAVRKDFAVGVRISPVDSWTQRGLVLADSVQLAGWLADDGIDFLHLSLGDASGPPPHEQGQPVVATAIREALPARVALLAAGGIWTRADADKAVAAGVDVAVVGKAAIRHADWASVSAGADWAPARPPWSRQDLQGQAVGDALIRYLAGFRGLLEAQE